MAVRLNVNGAEREVAAAEDTPLLYALRNDLGLKAARFGCATGQCGACFVLIDGRAVASCDTPLWWAAGKTIVTLEGLGTAARPHPLPRAVSLRTPLNSTIRALVDCSAMERELMVSRGSRSDRVAGQPRRHFFVLPLWLQPARISFETDLSRIEWQQVATNRSPHKEMST